MNRQRIIDRIRDCVKLPGSNREIVDAAMKTLKEEDSRLHWIGIYELKGSALHLGPYYGPETDHRVIPVGRGVCGTAVAEDANQIVDDVRAVGNYLACNLETRSEIVVLIRDPKSRRILAQIDADGTQVGDFGKADEEMLDSVGTMLARFFPIDS